MSQENIALVTGGAQGIGYACAQKLIEGGERVVIVDIKETEVMAAAEKLGSSATAMVCDMAKTDQVAQMFDQIEKDHGVVSMLVNNAGIAPSQDFLEVSVDDFRKVLDLNLVAVFYATQLAAKAMIKENIKGAIVNMSSINALVAIPTIPAYCASKGGVMQLTKSASQALAPHQIRVNAVGPGSINTQMLAGVNSSEKAMKTVLDRTPMRRIGEPEEIANTVAFLLSDQASFITGETIYVDGGRLGMNYLSEW